MGDTAKGSWTSRDLAMEVTKRPPWTLAQKFTALAEQTAILAEYLLEAHGPDMDGHHGGDAALPGEDPAGCSYCQEIDKARELLKALGREVTF